MKLRSPLSYTHINAAAHFAKLSYEIEERYKEYPSSDVFYQHQAYVIGCIITAASYLEATINELFANIADGCITPEELGHDIALIMANMWKVEIKPPNKTKPEKVYSPLDDLKPSILQKYQIALTLAQKDLFDTGKAPYQDIQYLIELRNALIHYKPEWWGDVEDYEKVLSEKLKKNLEFRIKRLNLLTGKDNPFFPNKCMGYGCAKWAVESSVNFTEEFFQKMGLSFYPDFYKSSRSLPKIDGGAG